VAETRTRAAQIEVTVRFFAAARAAAGSESETLRLRVGTTVAEMIEQLADRGTPLAAVLSRCSYLRNGIAVRDETSLLSAGDMVDVLPPFAGG
jgi:molybdopterin synthase sulfur carrier subunit